MVVVDAIANQLLAYFPMTLKEVATSRYYDLRVKNLRQAFTSVMAAYLKRKLDHSQQMSFVEVDVEVTEMMLGIPVKSVNPQACDGSPLWTYKVSFVDNHFNFKYIFPPSNYSSHTTMLAAIFARTNQTGDEALPIIMHPADQTTYATWLREVPVGF
nr:putative coat protein [Ipomoea batatas]